MGRLPGGMTAIGADDLAGVEIIPLTVAMAVVGGSVVAAVMTGIRATTAALDEEINKTIPVAVIKKAADAFNNSSNSGKRAATVVVAFRIVSAKAAVRPAVEDSRGVAAAAAVVAGASSGVLHASGGETSGPPEFFGDFIEIAVEVARCRLEIALRSALGDIGVLPGI